MKNISANELKTRGVSSIEAALQDESEALITVRGQERFVVMDIEAYNHLHVCCAESTKHKTCFLRTLLQHIDKSIDDNWGIKPFPILINKKRSFLFQASDESK